MVSGAWDRNWNQNLGSLLFQGNLPTQGPASNSLF